MSFDLPFSLFRSILSLVHWCSWRTTTGTLSYLLDSCACRATAFALFLKSQRKWSSAPLADDSVVAFKRRLREFGYEPKHVLPHGNYLVNLGNPDAYVSIRRSSVRPILARD